MSNAEKKEQGTVSSHQLHNMGCFAYLQQIALSPSIVKQLTSLTGHARLERLAAKQEAYDPNYAYADLFTALCQVNEETILPFIEQQKKEYLQAQASYDGFIIKNRAVDKDSLDYQTKANEYGILLAEKEQIMQDLHKYVISFFVNDNKYLLKNYEYLKSTIDNLSPTSLSAEKAIKELLHDKNPNSNVQTLSPEETGSNPVLFASMISSNFKPQHGTSLKTIIDNKEGEPTLLRLGTIAQRHEGKPRIDPLVDSYFEAQADKSPGKITHVTFNLLGRDRDGFEGEKEKELTQVIEDAEDKHLNVVMITLPADKGLMDGNLYKDIKAKVSYQDTIDELLLIATEDPNAHTKIKDFHISDKTRRLVFADANGNYSKETECAVLKALFDKSATTLQMDTTKDLSAAQQQALWFHFIKYELTHHILVTLNPVSYNIDCKDGIDRGAAHRAYYRLIKNIEAGTPMTRDAFQEALHAAAAGNKGRGMNHHHNMIWNAVDAYVSANYESIKNNEEQAWMLEWRDWNCPTARVDSVMKHRLGELIQELEYLKSVRLHTDEIDNALTILEKIQSIPGTSGRAILFEAALHVHAVAVNPNGVDAKRCADFAETVGIEHPTLAVFFGLIEKFAKKILVKLSVSEKMTDYLTAKIEGVKTEEHVVARNAVQQDIKQFFNGLRTEKSQEGTKEVVQEDTKRMSI